MLPVNKEFTFFSYCQHKELPAKIPLYFIANAMEACQDWVLKLDSEKSLQNSTTCDV